MAFSVHGSVHRWSISVTVQRDVTQSSLFIILQVHSTCFGFQPHPSSGVHETVTTPSGTVHLPPSKVAKLTWPLWREVWPLWREVAAQKIWPVPETVVTVLCAPDDGCGWHPKHVEWTCRIINRLLCVASRWTVINFVAVFMLLTRYNKAVYNVSREFAPLCYGPRHYSGSSSGEDELKEPVGHLFCWQTDSGPVCVTHYWVTLTVSQRIAKQPIADTADNCNTIELTTLCEV